MSVPNREKKAFQSLLEIVQRRDVRMNSGVLESKWFYDSSAYCTGNSEAINKNGRAEMNDHKEKDIGAIRNYYGGLRVKVEGGKAYWGIENHDGVHWQGIPESLYNELINFNDLGEDYSD